MSLAAEIRERLAVLQPESVELLDESGQHVGHAGAAGGGSHFSLIIVSPRFKGLGTLARHRLVYEALAPLMKTAIHALTICAHAPDEL